MTDICVKYLKLSTHVQVQLYLGTIGYVYDLNWTICKRQFELEFRDGADIKLFFPRLQFMQSKQLYDIYYRMKNIWNDNNRIVTNSVDAAINEFAERSARYLAEQTDARLVANMEEMRRRAIALQRLRDRL